MPTESVTTGCCIAGGGPAGMMLGYLLARAGVQVMVLEKHADFLRDFRGDTIHPSTLEIMSELGLLDKFLQRPHQEVRQLTGLIGDDRVMIADFSHLPTRCHFIVFMPQWDFLDFLADEARRYPNFELRMQAEVTDLIEQGGTVTGVKAKVPEGTLEVEAHLVVGADGRHSAVRDLAGLDVEDLGAPMDALWMRLSKRPGDPSQALGRIQAGRLFVMLDRGDYWQCAFVIPKGGFNELRRRGLPAFRAAIVELNPALADRVRELSSWDDVKLLTVRVDRLRRWYKPGVLCIGDAAHAMSPVGGVGINLAVQDAVAAANILAAPLRQGPVPVGLLAKVQRRREWPTRMMQAVQIFIQTRIIKPVLALQTKPRAPLVVKLLNRFPYLRRFPARLIGMGFRPEHVHSHVLRSQNSEARRPRSLSFWFLASGF
jgi:2-polyprenyl-6-methoxyphenol hydroxylase-like FAD-dependent oxidoreductase